MEIWIKSDLAVIVQERGSVCGVMTYSFMEGSLKSISRVHEVANINNVNCVEIST